MKKNYIDRLNDMAELEQYALRMAEEYRTKDDNGRNDVPCVEIMSAYNELARAARRMEATLKRRYGRNLDRLEEIEARELLR